jgi:hypothetical protein
VHSLATEGQLHSNRLTLTSCDSTNGTGVPVAVGDGTAVGVAVADGTAVGVAVVVAVSVAVAVGVAAAGFTVLQTFTLFL